MFAKTLAFSTLALLMIAPAAQALPTDCLFGYYNDPYVGPTESILGKVDRVLTCDAQAITEPLPVTKAFPCETAVQEPTGGPQIQPSEPACRVLVEEGPSTQSSGDIGFGVVLVPNLPLPEPQTLPAPVPTLAACDPACPEN